MGCIGGGLNFVGFFFLFICEKLVGKMNFIIRVVEFVVCFLFMRGVYVYDFGDIFGFILLMKMYIFGYDFIFDFIYVGFKIFFVYFLNFC